MAGTPSLSCSVCALAKPSCSAGKLICPVMVCGAGGHQLADHTSEKRNMPTKVKISAHKAPMLPSPALTQVDTVQAPASTIPMPNRNRPAKVLSPTSNCSGWPAPTLMKPVKPIVRIIIATSIALVLR